MLAALPSQVGRFIYISTTGVYGSAGGGWVDETTPTDPQRDGGKASLAAEKICDQPIRLVGDPSCDSPESTDRVACPISTSSAPTSRSRRRARGGSI